MSKFEQKKKFAEQVIIMSDDFIKSDIAKEILLKDDEKTPRTLTPRIQKEIEEHLEIGKKFIENIKDKELPSEIFSEEFKSTLFNKVDKLEELKKDIAKNFNFSQFNEIYVQNNGDGTMIFFYTVNDKFKESLHVSSLLVTDNIKGYNKVIRSKNDLLQSGVLLNDYGIYPNGNYTFVAITNDGQKIKVSIK